MIVNAAGDFLAWAAYSPDSQIRARVWSWQFQDVIAPDFFRERLSNALDRRQPLIEIGNNTALRLVHGESDGLPGLVLDLYADCLVMQCLSTGPEFWRGTLADLVRELTGVSWLYERSDVDVRRLEGLPERTGLIRKAPDQPESEFSQVIKIVENDLTFFVDLARGHKTGFYLDQRLNRLTVRELAAERSVLDCFSYTGGFAVNALAGGASSVVAIDSSSEALDLARRNLAINGLPFDRAAFLDGDVFQLLRMFRDQAQRFDLIVLDPPKFAPTASHVHQATRGYKDINLLAFKLLRPGGILVTFSCSGGVNEDLFQKIIAGAALDAGVDGKIIQRLHQAPDHPVALNFPEGAYLKGLVVQV